VTAVPDVTFVVATYDRPAWLGVAVRSIQLSIEFARLREIDARIVVVDDCSPGETTRAVCESLGVDYLRTPFNDGRNDPSAARRLGLDSVDTQYVAFFDDDDVMLPRWLPLHVESMRAGADLCHSAYYFTDAELAIERRSVPKRVSLGDMLAGHNMVNDHALVRSSLAIEVCDPSLGTAMPFGAWLELAFRRVASHRLTEPTYLYRRHASNMSLATPTEESFLRAKSELIDRYRGLVLERDGRLPPTSASLRARRALPSSLRRTIRRAMMRTAGRRGL
jgi:glycosyltransferase involved in cell wall biosynthesis